MIYSVRQRWISAVRHYDQQQLLANARFLLANLGLFVLFSVCFAFVQFGTPALADNDGYYHMRMGQLVRAEGLRLAFSWLPLSILNQDAFYDHHLLYHVYLALFVGDGRAESMILGAKLASVCMPALAGVAIWWLLRAQQVPFAALWSLGVCAISHAFLYRMSIPRAQSASLLVLVLALHWLLQRRYWLLLPLGFVYVWLYNAFPLLLVLASVYVFATLLTERQVAWQALVYPALGIALGLLINPYFPQNITFIIHHLVPKLGQPETSVGSEWYPYDTWTLVGNSGLALGIWLLGVLALGWREQRIDRSALSALLVSMVFGFMLFKARRFIEYFPPFALIFAAISCSPLLARWSRHAQQRRWAAFIFVGLLVATLGTTLAEGRRAMAASPPATRYAAVAAWLQANTPAGSMVFQTDWDDFPRLFFYNTNNHYLIGLDPTYMQLYNAALYDEWVAITRGKLQSPGTAIRDDFGARYVVSDHDHKDFLRTVANDPMVREVYRDGDAVIFAVGGE